MTAYEMRISDWSSDVCSSDLTILAAFEAYSRETVLPALREFAPDAAIETERLATVPPLSPEADGAAETLVRHLSGMNDTSVVSFATEGGIFQAAGLSTVVFGPGSSEEHTSELQSLMRLSY